MTALLACWVAFPLLLGVLAQGCGTLVERLSGRTLALGVRIPCGVALMIATMDLATRSHSTAHLAVAAVVVLAVVGLALHPPWRWHGLELGLAAGAIVFAVYAAPVVLSGMATWTGYIKLDDTATWLALVDRALTHGRTLTGLPPSTYRATLANYLTVGYPLGSFLPLGIGHTLLGQDIAWLVNPWMAFLAATLALALHRIAGLALDGPGPTPPSGSQSIRSPAASTLPPDSGPRLPTPQSGSQSIRLPAGDSPEAPPRSAAPKRRARAWPVAIATLAAQPALLYGYYLWGGLKEVAGAALIAAFAVAAPLALGGERRVRALIPVAVVLWALIAALSPGGLVWVGPGVLLALGLWALAAALRRGSPTRIRGKSAADTGQSASAEPELGSSSRADRPRGSVPPRRVLALAFTAIVGGVYLVLRPGGFVEHFRGVLTSNGELGNLVKPLSVEQVAGIWPTGDFRFAPAALAVTHVLVGIVVLCAAAGVVLALWEGRRELVLYVACAVGGALLVDGVAAPWLGAKALASASPALPLAALTVLAALAARRDLRVRGIAHQPGRAARKGAPTGRPPSEREGRSGGAFHAAARRVGGLRGVGVLVGCAVAAGIVWSNVLAYHDVNLAPREQFTELASIGERIAGQGPTLMTEYQPYGARHFLREAAPEAASELRMREDPLISGELLEKGESADIDQIQLQAVLVYRTVVLQRSPVGSRPPSPYRLTFADRFWEVWQRPVELRRAVIWHLPLGNATHPGAVPACPTVLRLARRRGVVDLVAVPVVDPEVAPLTAASHPPAWSTEGSQLAPDGAGTARLTVDVAGAGRYSVWLGGSIRGPLSVYMDGRRVGAALDEIQEPGQYIPFGELTLTPGRHTVALRYGGGEWRPGTGGPPEAIGPLVLRREAGPHGGAVRRGALITVPPGRAHTLCGRTLDWIEGVGA